MLLKSTATRLRNLIVRNVAAVQSPANQRKFLVIKADGGIVERPAPSSTILSDPRARLRLAALAHGHSVRYDAVTASRAHSDAETRALKAHTAQAFARSVALNFPSLFGERGVPENITVDHLRTLHDSIGALVGDEEDADSGDPEEGSDPLMPVKKSLPANVDLDVLEKAVVQMFRDAVKKAAPGTTPVDELERRIAELQKTDPGFERASYEAKVFADDPAFARDFAEYVDQPNLQHNAVMRTIGNRAKASFGINQRNEIVTKGPEIPDVLRRYMEEHGIEDPAVAYDRYRKEHTLGLSGGTLAASTLAKDARVSATNEVLRKCAELIAKNDKLDAHAAMNTVFKSDPTLYERYRRENAIPV